MEKLKVLIVDDEYLIRNLLTMRIDWAAQGMQIIGEASNAFEAMQLVDQLQPDIIFTDIYMPKVNGIEFSESVLAKYSHIKIVIVTGYDDFENARRSIAIGISEFILKPIRPAELLQVTSKLRDRIEEEHKRQHEIEVLKEENKRNYLFLRDKFLLQWLNGVLSEQEAYQKGQYFGLPLYATVTSLQIAILEPILLSLEEKDEQEQQLHALIARCKVEVELYYKSMTDRMILTEIGHKLVLISLSSLVDLAAECECLKERLTQSCSCLVSIGVGGRHKSIIHANLAYQEACLALNYQAFIGKNHVVCFDTIASNMDQSYHSNPELLRQLQFYISIGAPERAEELLTQIFDVSFSSVGQFQMAAMDVVMACQRATMEGQIEGKHALDRYILSAILNANHLPELVSILQEYTYYISEAIYEKKQVKEYNLVDQVKTYLENNIDNPDLGLASTAAEFFVSPGHLGRMMKKEIGQTFVEYLTQLRMKKAEELLKQTDMKGYEIGKKVGITDPHYFSTLFKKHTGRSMNEYRNIKS